MVGAVNCARHSLTCATCCLLCTCRASVPATCRRLLLATPCLCRPATWVTSCPAPLGSWGPPCRPCQGQRPAYQGHRCCWAPWEGAPGASCWGAWGAWAVSRAVLCPYQSFSGWRVKKHSSNSSSSKQRQVPAAVQVVAAEVVCQQQAAGTQQRQQRHPQHSRKGSPTNQIAKFVCGVLYIFAQVGAWLPTLVRRLSGGVFPSQ
jgi:hypothetical protein